MRTRSPSIAATTVAVAVAIVAWACVGIATPSIDAPASRPLIVGSAVPSTAPASTLEVDGASPPTSGEPSAGDLVASPSTAATPIATRTFQPMPTPTATVRPSWGDRGYAVGVRSPVKLSGTARVTVSVFAGPTCDINVRYPSGKSGPNFAAHTFTADGTWAWSWTVPSTAGFGSASVTISCMFGGVTKAGNGSFNIVEAVPTPTPKPTPTPTWDITGAVESSTIVPGTTVTFNGSITGTPPPGIAPIDLRCELTVTYTTGEHSTVSDGSVQTRDFTLKLTTAPAAPLGAGSWKVTCYPTAPGSRSVGGSLTFVGS